MTTAWAMPMIGDMQGSVRITLSPASYRLDAFATPMITGPCRQRILSADSSAIRHRNPSKPP